MSKSYKKKREQEDINIEEVGLSKKELYDLEKKKKLEQKEKTEKKKMKKISSKKKISKKTYQTNLAGRIFAVVMLLLMIGSIVASAAAYLS